MKEIFRSSCESAILTTWAKQDFARKSTARKKRVLQSRMLSNRQVKKLSSCRKNVSQKQVLGHRLTTKQSDAFPFRLLGRYVDTLPLNQQAKDKIYEKIKNRDRGVVAVLTSATEVEISEAIARKDSELVGQIYQARVLLKKYPFAGDTATCRSNAISRFFEAEELCKVTNTRLNSQCKDPMALMSSEERFIFLDAKRTIKKILGALDKRKIIGDTRTGPGLVNRPGVSNASETTAFFKYSEQMFSTLPARKYTLGMIDLDCHWKDTIFANANSLILCPERSNRYLINNHVSDIIGNRITFVPKDATTDRCIAIEPSGNVMLQLGVGSHIKTRLKSWGINLRDQSKNRDFAMQGSYDKDDSFCTIDLRMASDTLSIQTVYRLLPREWYNFLDELRCSVGSLKTSDGVQNVIYEKFSSMGNGFTFELESMIFFALTLASMRYNGFHGCHQDHISVFGDDIVVRKQFVPTTIKALQQFGFSINTEKSFVDGFFRESCGQDFVFGKNIRPFFLKRKVSSLRDIHFVANSLLQKSLVQKTVIHFGAYELLFAMIPKCVLLPGPLEFTSAKAGVDSWSDDEEHIGDLEGSLKVPLSWATTNGYYNICPYTMGLYYDRIVVSAINATNRSTYTSRPGYNAARYHIFLQGVHEGRITLRGVTRVDLKRKTTHSWDGQLSEHCFLPPVLNGGGG